MATLPPFKNPKKYFLITFPMKISTWFRNALARVSIFVMLVSMIFQSLPFAHATIAATDHFTVTSAGNATTMDSGSTLVFTVKGYNGSNVARVFSGSDKGCVTPFQDFESARRI
jgi:hypothetical protein